MVALVGVVGALLVLVDRGTDVQRSEGTRRPSRRRSRKTTRSRRRLGSGSPCLSRGCCPLRGSRCWAPVLRAVDIRVEPSTTGQIVARAAAVDPRANGEHRARHRPHAVCGRALGSDPGRRSEGLGPTRSARRYEAVDTRLLVDTRSFTATLLRANRVVFRARVGVGTAAAPTPTGSFYVRNRLTRYRSAFYGPVAFGTSARTALTDWPAGGFVGIHGTSRPELLPGRVSHGCIRMRNADILALARLMPVGTPVEIT